MTNDERIALLQSAKLDIEMIVEDCDMTSRVCGGCGLHTYKNFDDYQLAKKCRGMMSKIDGEIRRLRESDHG